MANHGRTYVGYRLTCMVRCVRVSCNFSAHFGNESTTIQDAFSSVKLFSPVIDVKSSVWSVVKWALIRRVVRRSLFGNEERNEGRISWGVQVKVWRLTADVRTFAHSSKNRG